MPITDNPRVTDDDKGEIKITLAGQTLRSWSYSAADGRSQRETMGLAREYVEGWCDCRQDIAEGLDPPC